VSSPSNDNNSEDYQQQVPNESSDISSITMTAETTSNSNENMAKESKDKPQKLKDMFIGLKSNSGESSATKKKFTLFDKKTFQPKNKQQQQSQDTQQDLFNKLISPMRTTTPSPTVPVPSSSITSALLSPVQQHSITSPSFSNSQVLSNFLATFTNASSSSAKVSFTANTDSNNIAGCTRSASTEHMTSSITFQYYLFLSMAVSSGFFICISPLPSFINGFIFGFLMTFFIVTIGIIYLVANFFLIKSDDPKRGDQSGRSEGLGLKRTKSKRLPFNVSSTIPNNDGIIYAGWVYEFIGDYIEREKNGFVSRLVYLVLSGSKLNIFVPSQEISDKKLKQILLDPTSGNNRNFALQSQKVIDFSRIHHKRICLYLTKNVRNQRKYIWSKKYPICIEFNEEIRQDDNLDNSFQSASPTPILSKLVIFARTCREKEEWFWAIKTSIDSIISSSKNSISVRGSNNSLNDSPRPGNPGMMTALTWFNVLLNRLSFDILNKPNWSAYIAKKLQRKLRRLRLPYFMESLTITEIDIGTTLPKFNSVPSVPTVDDAGLWIEFDVNYSGGFTMTLETKINLLKLSANVENFADVSPASTPNDSPKLTQKIGGKYWSGYRAKYRSSAIGTQSPAPGTELNDEFCDDDSDLDSIITSSEDEEPETAPAAPDDADTDEKQKKLIRFVEKIASNQYFQKASQMNFVKKALEGVSNMSIMLTVQINSLNGTLAINIPEPPTDRLWYGFRNDPSFSITARPKLGDHDLNLSYVTNFIEKKLRNEFFNYFVIPNMDDFFIPSLNTGIEQYINVVP
ncbi:Tabersonine 6,7-epoxidase isoform 2, partial [Dermatophagoides pteronyssinus]